jgi:hypothetical protein
MPPTQFHNDREWFVLSKEDDEVVPWMDQVSGAEGVDRNRDMLFPKSAALLLGHADDAVLLFWQGDWGPEDKCAITGRQLATIQLPHNFTTASGGLPANHMGNNGLGE